MNNTYHEKEIIDKIKEGDDSAFRNLVKFHEQNIANVVIGMLGNTPEAEDVAQDVFIKFWKGIENFRGQSSVRTYLTRIAINLSINELNKRKKFKNRFELKENIQSFPIDSTGFTSNYELKELLEHELQKLEPGQRSVFILRLVEGYSTKETADILKIPQGTVLSRLHRSIELLKSGLKNSL